MDRAFTDADKLAILRETFSVHIILAYFCSEERFDYTRLGLIARDNLKEVCIKGMKLRQMTPYKQLLSQASGVPIEQVRKALTFTKNAN